MAPDVKLRLPSILTGKPPEPEEERPAPGEQGDKVIEQRKILYQWKAPMRHFKRMNKRMFFIIVACVLAFFVVLVLVKQYWLMAAIAAVMFLVYAVGTVPPVSVVHTITNLGIESLDQSYKWADLKEYWFSKKDDQMILNIDTKLPFPGRLILLVSDKEAGMVHSLLKEKLVYRDLRKQNRYRKLMDGQWVNMLEDQK